MRRSPTNNSQFSIINSQLTKFSILHSPLIIVLLLCLLLSSCNKSTAPKSGSLSGRVTLVNDTGDPSLDPADFSGVTVALYGLAVLDSTIVRINSEYPQIGVQISQETEFDHRLQNPIGVVTTNSEGNFSFIKITPGTYNVAIMKEGWGLRYYYNVAIHQGDQVFADVSAATLELYPAIELSPTIQTDMTFKSHHTYLIIQDVLILGSSTIEPNTKLLIDNNKRLSISGNLSYGSGTGFWTVTSSHGIYSTEIKSDLGQFDLLSFEAQVNATMIKNLILSYGNNGLKTGVPAFSISNSIIRSCSSSGLTMTSSNNVVDRILLTNTTNKGLSTYYNLSLSKSVFVKNHECIMVNDCNATIENSYFFGSYLGIRTYLKQGAINNNCFDRNSVAIGPNGASPYIRQNNFYDNLRDVEMNRGGSIYSLVYCNPTISHNNFFGNKFYIHLKGSNSTFADGYIPFMGVNSNQTYPNNYLREQTLTSHIYDSSYPGSGVLFTVTMQPRSSIPISSAGIN
ncbi:MAG: carboxypeptidase-like regulatory domain-containing protein [Candidatus Cloacimonetes bacterium]|nr:carboxypeptidase-like regulatory domain-containing protein [Candidatus Cloacimonadota bacterium]